MDIHVRWLEPIPLISGERQGLIYMLKDASAIPSGPGVYAFARKFGERVAPLYVGRAENLAKRIDQQFNNVRLMMGLKNAERGKLILLVGELKLRRGQRANRVLEVVENALIAWALEKEHDILNRQGTRTPFHTISFRGGRRATASWTTS